MTNLTGSNFTNISSKFTNSTSEERGDTANVSFSVSYSIAIVINSITCPFTVLLNVLVIMAVKRRPRLQTNANILLACLAVTDALTGLTSQPSFIVWKISESLDMKGIRKAAINFHGIVMRVLSVCSCLHLMLVTCERLIAIKFTMHYENIVTKRKIKVAVISCWIFTLFAETFKRIKQSMFSDFLIALVLISCIVFVASSYVILYYETRRHQKMIKTQQMPQEEVERLVKENKALKTTLYVVGALALCFLPMGFSFVYNVIMNAKPPAHKVLLPFVRMFAMLNSLLNPLIYCLRQTEMRKFIFLKQTPVVHPAH